jgi:hypothetical protein
MEFLIGASRAYRVFSFINDKVKEKKIKNRLSAHGYSENDVTFVEACIEYFTSSERDRYKAYKNYYKEMFEVSQDKMEKLLELGLIGALQYEDVGDVIIGNLNKAHEAREEARKLMAELNFPIGEPITMHDILFLALQMRKE